MKSFATLSDACEVTGVALHSGQTVRVRLLPRTEVGIVLARTDLPDAPEISACFDSIGSTHHATTLVANGVAVGMTEHLLAALWSMGITHCRIELDGNEIPILDGSAVQWCELIQSAGITTLNEARLEYSLRELVVVQSRGGAVIGLPHECLRVTTDVEYGVEYVAPQVFSGDVTPQLFQREIAPARTFTLEGWIEPLRALNLIRGGSEENAVVLWKRGASSPLRFETELARHKALDLIGDISLLFGNCGASLHAQLIGVRAGHELHRQWMEEVIRCNALEVVEGD